MRFLLLLLALSFDVLARPVNIVWDNAPGNPAGTTTEVTANGMVQADIVGSSIGMDVPILSDNMLNIKARAIPPAGYQCGTPLALCPPSPYVSISLMIPGEPSNLTAILVSIPTPIPGITKSIWPEVINPAIAVDPDTAMVELGTRFSSTKAGVITGVRFWKGGSANTGSHIANLYSNSGVKLGSTNYGNESDAGWQTAFFPLPIAILANTNYVASVIFPVGKYAAENSGLLKPVVNAPLTALSGLYKYGGGFPTSTYKSSSYFIDVLFQ